MEILEISIEEAKKHLDEGKTSFIDIRDSGSFEAGHIEGALSLNETNLDQYLATADKENVHIIYCYHGNSSKGASGFFQEQGFAKVYSMSGGFTEWAKIYNEN